MSRLALVIAAALALSACGPEQSTRDLQQQTESQFVLNGKSQLDPLQGDYCGAMQGVDGKPIPLVLRLREISILVTDSSQDQVTEIPSMMGLMAGINDNQLQWGFSQGNYDPHTSTLTIYGGSSAGGTYNYMKLQPMGDKLTGEFLSNQHYSTVSFTRTKTGSSCK